MKGVILHLPSPKPKTKLIHQSKEDTIEDELTSSSRNMSTPSVPSITVNPPRNTPPPLPIGMVNQPPIIIPTAEVTDNTSRPLKDFAHSLKMKDQISAEMPEIEANNFDI